jgi:FKBP-type peptidyl-prolyl cis-trans isomerases 1
MALKKHQQIAVSIILGLTIVGTVGSFFVMALESSNQRQDQQKYQDSLAKYQNDQKAYQAKVDAQAKTLSKTYFKTFAKYQDLPAKFDKATITKLETSDLKVGNGAKIDKNTKFATYYLGWTPDGKVFDGSIDNGSLKSPFSINSLASGGVIEGWQNGLIGMKIGGVRQLAIPSDQAYGKTGSQGIPGDTPLKFVVMAITQPKTIEQPQIPIELLQQGAIQ